MNIVVMNLDMNVKQKEESINELLFKFNNNVEPLLHKQGHIRDFITKVQRIKNDLPADNSVRTK
jgi:hypothetical protein